MLYALYYNNGKIRQRRNWSIAVSISTNTYIYILITGILQTQDVQKQSYFIGKVVVNSLVPLNLTWLANVWCVYTNNQSEHIFLLKHHITPVTQTTSRFITPDDFEVFSRK